MVNYGLNEKKVGMLRVATGWVIVNFPRAGSGRVNKFENATGRVGSRVSQKFSYGSRVKGKNVAGQTGQE